MVRAFLKWSLPKSLKQLRIAAHGGGPMGEGLDHTQLGWEVMVTVPLLIQVQMCRFPVYSDGQMETISLWFNNSVQEGDGTILPCCHSTVNPMAGSSLLMPWRKLCFKASYVDDRSVIHIQALEQLWKWGAVLRSFCSKYSMYNFATMGLTGEPMAAPSTFSFQLALERKVCVFETKFQ